MNNREKELLSDIVSFAFVMSENMVGLSKGDYDEKRFIEKTYDYLQKYVGSFEFRKVVKALMSIEESKEQEDKNYLKWEDLEFKDIQQEIKVKLGNITYSLWYNLERGDQCVELTRNQQQVIALYGSYKEDILFFNELRLEKVE